MTKIQTNEIMNIEITKASSRFTLANESWMPEVRSGNSLLVLQNDIKLNGLLEPIIADSNGVIYVGRSRYKACEALKVALKVLRMSTEKAKQQAMSDCLQRFHTVLDRVRFVLWVQQGVKNQKLKGNLRKHVSQKLQKTWGWTAGGSEGQVQKYQEIIALMEKSKDKAKVETVLRKAAHLHEAWGNLFPEKASKAATKSQSGSAKKSASKPDLLGKLKSELKKIGTDPTKAPKVKLISFVKKVRTLVEPALKRKPKKG